MRYLTAMIMLAVGVACLKSAPGPIIPYLHTQAKNSEDFARGLKVAMVARRALGIVVIALAMLTALKR